MQCTILLENTVALTLTGRSTATTRRKPCNNEEVSDKVPKTRVALEVALEVLGIQISLSNKIKHIK